MKAILALLLLIMKPTRPGLDDSYHYHNSTVAYHNSEYYHDSTVNSTTSPTTKFTHYGTVIKVHVATYRNIAIF